MQAGDIVGGRFEVEALCGAGGMGTVWRSRDRTNGRFVALKLLIEDVANAERFAREAQVLARLRHPAIVEYIAQGHTEQGEPYLAMAWLEGEDLAQRLTREGLSVPHTLVVIRRIAEALGAAHGLGIVHRDVKPENIFLVGRDVAAATLLDFGIARQLQATRAATQTGAILGTPAYMSPEQARGEKSLDARADVFALGCVLFECLTGRAVFVAEHVVAVLAKLLLEDPPRVSELRPHVSIALDDLVARMLSKARTQRPADASAVCHELDALDALEASGAPSRVAQRAALTTSEQRLISVVMAGTPTSNVLSGAPTVASGAPDDWLTAIRAAVAPFGGQAVALRDRSLVVSLPGVGAAPDQAMRAARCARVLRDVVANVPIVVATGRGNVGERLPVGEVIDRAAALLSEPEMRPGVIRVDALTAGLLDGRFDLEPLGASAIHLFGEARPHDPARKLLGRATPCVGRERELRVLEGLLKECRDDSLARVVLVTGAAGAGKSRVRSEFLDRVTSAEASACVWLARGDAMRTGSLFGITAALVRDAVGMHESDPPVTQHARIASHVARILQASDAERVADFVGEITGAPYAGDDHPALRAARRNAALMADQVQRAWCDFVAAESTRRPVIMVLEDLHWADAPSVSLIDVALRTVNDRPIMIVAFARPEVHAAFPRLWSERDVIELRLPALARRASEAMVREALGDRVADSVVNRIVDRAGGNALFIEELIRAEAEGSVDAPDTVLAMLEARLGALSPELRRGLRAASVFGSSFWLGAVRALVGDEVGGLRLDATLAELCEREVIVTVDTTRYGGETTYAFVHALVRDAAYAMLTESDRALGHRLAGEWLASVHEPDAMLLAQHFDAGRDPRRASEWFARAAEQAFAANDVAGVIARSERAIALGATGGTLGVLRSLGSEALGWQGENALAEAWGIEAMSLLREGSARWCAAVAELATVYGNRGNTDALLGLCARLEHAPTDASDPTAIVPPLVRAYAQSVRCGMRAPGDALFARLERVVTGDSGDPMVRARWHQALAMRGMAAGDYAAFTHESDAAAGAFASVGDLRNATMQRANVGYGYLMLGAFAESEHALREVIASAERFGLPVVVLVAQGNLGMALAGQGAWDEAERVASTAVAAIAARDNPRMEGLARVYLATILEARGALEPASHEADAAIARLEAHPSTQVYALARSASVLLALGATADARARARDASALMKATPSAVEAEGLTRLMDAVTLEAIGEHSQARAAITTACNRLRQRAESITDPRLRESFLENVAEHALTFACADDWLGRA